MNNKIKRNSVSAILMVVGIIIILISTTTTITLATVTLNTGIFENCDSLSNSISGTPTNPWQTPQESVATLSIDNTNKVQGTGSVSLTTTSQMQGIQIRKIIMDPNVWDFTGNTEITFNYYTTLSNTYSVEFEIITATGEYGWEYHYIQINSQLTQNQWNEITLNLSPTLTADDIQKIRVFGFDINRINPQSYVPESAVIKFDNFVCSTPTSEPVTVYHTLTINSSPNAVTNPSSGSYEYVEGTQISISLDSIESDYEFEYWQVNGENLGSSTTISIVINEDIVVEPILKIKTTTGSNIDDNTTNTINTNEVVNDVEIPQKNIFPNTLSIIGIIILISGIGTFLVKNRTDVMNYV